MKLSEWFYDCDPVHIGWYHVKWSNGSESGFNWWWNGKHFGDDVLAVIWSERSQFLAWRGQLK